jgi:alkanesulfonate monooxygenase SsuD/methylene tetrahydromethanopterin reductase-like flavin-dependent oxidoreductase (luciferase family)
MLSRMQLGLSVPTDVRPGMDPVALAQLAEHLGFDFVSSSDHPEGTSPTYENWTMLTWIAAATSRIKVATRVLGVPYRSPAMVAKMAESLQRLSGGRLILGLGGGSSDDEHHAFGLGVRTPREKVDGLEQAIAVIRGLWTEREFTFTGTLYSTEEADIEPKPETPIPIWLGTYGPRALRLTGHVADGWIPSLGYASEEAAGPMIQRVLDAAAEAGRDRSAIACIFNVEVRFDEPAGDAAAVTGSTDEILERLRRLAALGFDGFNFMVGGPGAPGLAQRLADEVLPALR